MAVKAVVLDLDGTLIDNTASPVPGVPESIAELRQLGLKIAIASNRPNAAVRVARAGLDTDFVIDRALMRGMSKGSPTWTTRILEEFDIENNELVWLGDSDLDMRSAVNSKVIYFNAQWSMSEYPYGIHLTNPRMLPAILREFFLNPVGWYWELSRVDKQGRRVIVKAMMDARGAGIDIFRSNLINVLKDGGNPRVGSMSVRDFIFFHFIGSIYHDDFYRETDIWTVYPGSRGGPNAVLEPFAALAARLFKERYYKDLLVRHTQSIDSGEARRRNIEVDFSNQTDTIQLNEEYRRKIQGKRVVVIDDFATRGYSSECARLLLLQAGAADVTAVNVSKYGYRHEVMSVQGTYTWDPFSPVSHPERTFRSILHDGPTNSNALRVIHESYMRIRQTP